MMPDFLCFSGTCNITADVRDLVVRIPDSGDKLSVERISVFYKFGPDSHWFLDRTAVSGTATPSKGAPYPAERVYHLGDRRCMHKYVARFEVDNWPKDPGE